MSSKSIKRFYKESAAELRDGGFAILLDGKPIKTPGGRPLSVPAKPLAEAIAGEWRSQGEQVLPSSMPMTQLASTAIDRVGPERPHITGQLMNYAGTDLLCYRAETPGDLVARQTAAWQPLLDWAAQALDAPLLVTTALAAIAQPDASLAALRRHVDAYDDWRLTALQSSTAAMGSLILGLALMEGRLDPEAAFQASQLDETYQIELWGEDWEAADRRAELRGDIDAAARFRDLITPS
ncbi:ATP12 family chaperone protein [Paramagnetospirillum magneticum]|uniref:Chaperone required for the assembly of the mitochondrial F1-ATPase n=1 Tax=Paramagnetospirillum magneticum (strain ATCC 700264 / AMB-1) TaxID=342108 RepID=Q2W2L6_PARM1|nr:ATP12 family protein [Paramagnetospirillum magneticum]BAE51909.1 Chaperone required for the assembly of the mitochondrial F1-ATPase [Paramagnetospirillum magneticum AMB-1]